MTVGVELSRPSTASSIGRDHYRRAGSSLEAESYLEADPEVLNSSGLNLAGTLLGCLGDFGPGPS